MSSHSGFRQRPRARRVSDNLRAPTPGATAVESVDLRDFVAFVVVGSLSDHGRSERQYGASGRADESADAALKSVVALLPYPGGCQTRFIADPAFRSSVSSETLKNSFSAVSGLPAGPGSYCCDPMTDAHHGADRAPRQGDRCVPLAQDSNVLRSATSRWPSWPLPDSRTKCCSNIRSQRLWPRPSYHRVARNAIATRWRKLIETARDPYQPELHYMRGPGPKWRAK